MLSVDLNAISDLLDKALDLDGPARDAWLAELANAKPDVAKQLKALLSRQGELETDQLLIDGGRALGPDVLAKARIDSATARVAGSQFMLQSGTTIGPYRLIRPLGEGGMASVWLADRIDGQLKREVALKLLHAWRNSRELVERFARERDMLAGLAHPNIARLYDAGVTANGQPWIALEYVEGLDLAAFADQNALSIRSRVESILQVMTAVQYAHQNLIVHRDLKPTNILVNKKGEVRLLDFGIAKLLQQENVSAAETELTRNSGRALTLRYAAPEQIEGKPITTATDVYALGLVLYELLTGASARDGKHGTTKTGKNSSARNNAFAEQAALNTEILRPSHGPFTETAALNRGKLAPHELKKTLSGDIDTILLKALAREPARRYATVSEFAGDLRAWLERRPITARAPSIAYQIQMFISRQRVAVGFASAIAVVLVVAGAYSQTQRTEAAAQRARAEEVQIFMANILSEAEPEGVKGEAALTAKGLLDAGVARAREDYVEKPLVRGEMLAELARVYLRIGESETGENLLKEAIALIEKNAPADEPSLHIARSHLGGQLMGSGDREPADAMLKSVLAGCTRETTACVGAKGNAHLQLTADPIISYEKKLAHARSAIEMFEKSFGPNSSNTWMALITSADLERSLGNFALATQQLDLVGEYFLRHRARAQERYLFGTVQSKLAADKGEYANASKIIDRMLAELPPQQQTEARLYLHVFAANLANYQGLNKLAIAHADAAKLAARDTNAPVSEAYGLFAESRSHRAQSEYDLAEDRLQKAFSVLTKAGYSEKSEFWLDGIRLHAEVNARRGNLKSAREQLENTLASFRASYPTQFMDQAHVLDSLGAVSLAMGNATLAKTHHDEEAKLLDARLPIDHPLRLRAALQRERAAAAVSQGETHQKRVVEIAMQLKSKLPPESTYAPILEAIIGNKIEMRELVFIF
jgi:eukaryotic-like serine/threonine-protein kinase